MKYASVVLAAIAALLPIFSRVFREIVASSFRHPKRSSILVKADGNMTRVDFPEEATIEQIHDDIGRLIIPREESKNAPGGANFEKDEDE